VIKGSVVRGPSHGTRQSSWTSRGSSNVGHVTKLSRTPITCAFVAAGLGAARVGANGSPHPSSGVQHRQHWRACPALRPGEPLRGAERRNQNCMMRQTGASCLQL
jgi:hypothetical protein